MKKFFARLVFFLIIPGLILFFIIINLPPSATFKKSLYYALIDKNKLLEETQSPRIIFIGGSNLSFSLNSKIIKDSLNINPINTGLNAPAGLKFMLENTKKYIRKDDIIVIVPEYQQFYDDYADGDIGLLSTLIDVSPSSIKLLDFKQYIKLSGYLREYLLSKYSNFIKQNNKVSDTIGIYDRLSFNRFGDTYVHWDLPKEKIVSLPNLGENFNTDVINSLVEFKKFAEKKHAKLFFSFPCCQDSSYENSKEQIKTIEHQLIINKFCLISSPEKYIMSDSLLFNTPYHLNKKGVDYRTNLLIEDIKKSLMQ